VLALTLRRASFLIVISTGRITSILSEAKDLGISLR
jgi:hypothetical protein